MAFEKDDQVLLNVFSLFKGKPVFKEGNKIGWKKRNFVPKFIGPYKIVGNAENGAYRLKLPFQYLNIHPIFHVP
ncbi:hypothetical protein LNK20_20795, partial [Bacillus safensis]|uniref:hypothetical protein n=1 Tax=Bacillus safensis TaxID=561879 RepID=UPI001FF95763